MATGGDREKRPFSSGRTERAWETLVYPCSYVTLPLPARQQVCRKVKRSRIRHSAFQGRTAAPHVLEYSFHALKSRMHLTTASFSIHSPIIHIRAYSAPSVSVFIYFKVLESLINFHEKSLLMLMGKITVKCSSNSHFFLPSHLTGVKMQPVLFNYISSSCWK